ncbi:MAG: class II aldolase/adducin family protein [Peptococcaceae bacterium]|nr:class II aldolase/adducin family protein [Peptococcaceae bacterium]
MVTGICSDGGRDGVNGSDRISDGVNSSDRISDGVSDEINNRFGCEFWRMVGNTRREMCWLGRRLFARRLVTGKSGNISVRVPEYLNKENNVSWPGGFLIKATDRSFDDIVPVEFLLVNNLGEVLSGRGRPSGEMGFHQGIYLARPEIHAIVHGHSAYVTAYVLEKGELALMTEEARHSIKRLGYVDYITPRSAELAERVTEVFRGDLRVAVLRDHGFVTVAETLREAYYLADALEETARVACIRNSFC